MAKNNIPLGIKITGWWIRTISFIIAAVSVAIAFFWLKALVGGCDKNAQPCAPGAICDIPCLGFATSMIVGLILDLILFGVAALIFFFSKKLLQVKKSGWYGALAVLFLINGLAVYFFIFNRILHSIGPVAAFVLPLVNFVPLILLLAGRKEFFNFNK